MKAVIHIEHDGVNRLTWTSNCTAETFVYILRMAEYALISGKGLPGPEGRPPDDVVPPTQGSVLSQRLSARKF